MRLGAAVSDLVLLARVVVAAVFVAALFKPVNDGEVWLLALALSALYSVGFELSPWRATPGLRWQGYMVARPSGDPIGFLHATGRWAAKVATLLSFMTGFLPVLCVAGRVVRHAGRLLLRLSVDSALRVALTAHPLRS